MPNRKKSLIHHYPHSDFLAEWILSEGHFNVPTCTTCTSSQSTASAQRPALSHLEAKCNLHKGQFAEESPVACVPSDSKLTDDSKQSVGDTGATIEVPSDKAQGHDALSITVGASASDASTVGNSAVSFESHLSTTATCIPGDYTSHRLAHTAEAPSASHAARPPAPSTPCTDPAVARVAFQSSSLSRSASRASRSRVGRHSYQLLWREYLALTANDQPQHRQQQQGVIGSRGGQVLTQTRSQQASTRIRAEMSAVIPRSTGQIPLPYDQPQGLVSLFLLVLCPPTDIIDMQRLTKQLIRLFAFTCITIVKLSCVLVPFWLCLVRHHMLEGRPRDAIKDLVTGLLILFTADWIEGTAGRTESIRQSGIFTASTTSAYQRSLPRYTSDRRSTIKPTEVPVPLTQLSHASSLVATGIVTHPQPTKVMNNAVGPSDLLDPNVQRVKRRIIKLEKILFGNDLTEESISREALGSCVQVLCRKVGVPFGGPGSTGTWPTAAELEQQLHAVEMTLGVL